MGVVYLVKDSILRGREVALKMIHPELITHEEARQRFIDEVLLCLNLHHSNIVIAYPIEETDRNLFFTMEYIPGYSLRKLIKDRRDSVPPFTLEEACIVITQILDALEYAHQITIHRDIKPENILVQGMFPDVQVKLLDFGIAKVMSASRFTRTAQSMGTAYYMSPEQMKGTREIDLSSDLYAVGMILYEMLTGEMAVGWFEMPSKMVRGLPPELDEFIKKVLAPRPEMRFDSALSMKNSLNLLLESRSPKDKSSKQGKQEQGRKSKLQQIGDHPSDNSTSGLAEDETPAKERKNSLPQKLNWVEPITGMEFVWVEGGCFEMGDTFGEGNSDEKPVHEVCLDGFWMGRYEVAQAEYQKIMGKNPSNFKGDRRPVENVSWEDAKSFISELNRRTGRIFSLPTEAQWEYAAREGGKRVRFGTGKDTIGPDEANFKAIKKFKKTYSRSGENREKTVNAGSFSSNSLGLYDMSGNVSEWCEDVYDKKAYKKHSKNNPVITSMHWMKVARGGDWHDPPTCLRAASRGLPPQDFCGTHGFRLALETNKTSQPKQKKTEPEETKSSRDSVIEKYALYVETKPSETNIKILNIKPKFRQGIQLAPGRYKIEVSSPGYIIQSNWYTLKSQSKTIRIELIPVLNNETKKIAIINPDHYRILKCGIKKERKSDITYFSIANGDVKDRCKGFEDSSCWSGVGNAKDFIGSILEDHGYEVDYYEANEIRSNNIFNYGIVIVQDPLRINLKKFDARRIERAEPNLLEYTTDREFLATLKSYINSGGNIVLVGDAVKLIEKIYGKTILSHNVSNHVDRKSDKIPNKWLFIRGNPFCGKDRIGSASSIVTSSLILPSGKTFATLSLKNLNDVPSAETWSETVYYPKDGTSLLTVRFKGNGKYVLKGSTCNPPQYTVTVDETIPNIMGYTSVKGQKIYYIGTDAFFDYQYKNHEGSWHAAQYSEISYKISKTGKSAVINLIELAMKK